MENLVIYRKPLGRFWAQLIPKTFTKTKIENQAMRLGVQSKIVMLVKFIAEQGAIDISRL